MSVNIAVVNTAQIKKKKKLLNRKIEKEKEETQNRIEN